MIIYLTILKKCFKMPFSGFNQSSCQLKGIGNPIRNLSEETNDKMVIHNG